MSNYTLEENCDCPVECNSLSYSFTLISTPFDAQKMCPKNIGPISFLMKEFYQNENKFPTQFVRKLIKLNANVSSNEIDYCFKNIQYRAEIIFRLASNQMSVTVMSRRLSFFDKMSAFGKDNFQSSIDSVSYFLQVEYLDCLLA